MTTKYIDQLADATANHVQPLQELLSMATRHIQNQNDHILTQAQHIYALQRALGESLAREVQVAESWDGCMYDLHAVGMVDIGKTLRADLNLEPK